MKNMKKFLPFCLIAGLVGIVLSGCAGLFYDINDPALLKDHLTKAYNQPAPACMEAALYYFDDKGVRGVADLANGTIQTRRFPVWQGAIVDKYAASAQAVVVEMQVHFEITGNDNQCIVRATKLRFWQNDKEMTNISTTDNGYAKYWKPIFSGIKNNLEDLTQKYDSEKDVREIVVESVTNITMPLVLKDAPAEDAATPVVDPVESNTSETQTESNVELPESGNIS